MHPRVFAAVALAVMMAIAGGPSWAQTTLPSPTGPVVLSVTGEIGRTNVPGGAEFDMAMLEDLPQTDMRTFTDWTEGHQIFTGPSLTDLLSAVAAEGSRIKASALNGYAIEIPVSDAAKFGPIVAIRQNGAPMSVRDKGPLWIIYPNEDQDALTPNPNNDKSVWQLRTMELQ